MLWTTWEVRPWYDDKGSIGGIIVNTEVINDRKQVELELRDKVRYLKSILETTRDGFWIVDDRGKIVDVNQAAFDMSGYTRDELLGIEVTDIDAEETAQSVRRRIGEVRRTGHAIFESTHRRKDGSTYPVEMSVSFLDEEHPEFVCFCRDLSSTRPHSRRQTG